jgi:hypothetical protein
MYDKIGQNSKPFYESQKYKCQQNYLLDTFHNKAVKKSKPSKSQAEKKGSN